MPKRTMGGRADAMEHEASKRRAKLHMEKALPTDEGSSRQQGGLDVVDHVQAPVQVSPTPEQVAALAPQTEQVSPLPRVTPPVPKPVVVGVVNKEDVAPLASLLEQVVAPQPQPGVRLMRLLPPLPAHVVVADENEEEVLSDDVDSDPETQWIFRRQKVRQLDSGELEKAVRPRFRNGYGCPYCNKVMKGDLSIEYHQPCSRNIPRQHQEWLRFQGEAHCVC
ncbi:hypothetical protein CFC21_003201 [Triticum aestivum]|uniref:Uncharacterized protein n=1 Tax=Triticum aestivum TaxID=4565 RepID=A0A3B6SD55_WHEAT|nr:hypothetical protein CFC21_003201 [Triticum aestivum]